MDESLSESALESAFESVSQSSPPQSSSGGLTVEGLTELLTRIGLAPWRVNAYDGGRGQILWLQNGSHFDLNPSGELILGGENQEETRARLSQLGVSI